MHDRLPADLAVWPERAGTVHHQQKKEAPTLLVRGRNIGRLAIGGEYRRGRSRPRLLYRRPRNGNRR
jgi:hypothetical protein